MGDTDVRIALRSVHTNNTFYGFILTCNGFVRTSRRDLFGGRVEVYFNELCLNQTTMIQYADISRIGTLYKRLRSRNILGCRISHNDYAEVIRQVGTMQGTNPNVISFLFAFLRQPYEDEGVEERQEDYLSSSWSYEGKACYGLALAYIMESMSVSICDQAWNQPILQVQRDSATEDVRNLYDEETFLYHLEWLEGLQPIELIICQNSPEEKRIKLREDHGKDILQAFCDRLVNSKYVVEIINSMPFNSKNRRFIHKIREEGIIEIVLPWTDKGHGVVVKTTGRNRRETEKIAEILKEKYGSM